VIAVAVALAAAAADPVHWLATKPGLIRNYEGRAKDGHGKALGASCEVVARTDASVRDRCTTIADRQARAPAELTYAVRAGGVYAVSGDAERLLFPNPPRAGATVRDGNVRRTVRSAGKSCKAAGRTFADCLIVDVSQKGSRSTEIYAAGVGLVEDSQWQLIDITGL
jgi:hypothetical protein